MSGNPHPRSIELLRRLREQWLRDIGDILRRIDPALLSGSLSAGALPTGTMVDRGAYSATARYRPGDVVTAGGVVYVAVAASTGVPVTDTGSWRPLGGTGGTVAAYEALSIGGELLTIGGATLVVGV